MQRHALPLLRGGWCRPVFAPPDRPSDRSESSMPPAPQGAGEGRLRPLATLVPRTGHERDTNGGSSEPPALKSQGFRCAKGGIGRTACGRCEPCLAKRRWLRKNQIIGGMYFELLAAEADPDRRSWFCRLSYRPRGTHWRPSARNLKEDWPAARDKLYAVLRKLGHPKSAMSYRLAPEYADIGGRFHVHVLLHVPNDVKYEHLKTIWSQGQTDFRLVQSGEAARTARYLAKYMGKDPAVRGQKLSSNFYGDQAFETLMETTVAHVLADETLSAEIKRLRRYYPQTRVSVRPHAPSLSDREIMAALAADENDRPPRPSWRAHLTPRALKTLREFSRSLVPVWDFETGDYVFIARPRGLSGRKYDTSGGRGSATKKPKPLTATERAELDEVRAAQAGETDPAFTVDPDAQDDENGASFDLDAPPTFEDLHAQAVQARYVHFRDGGSEDDAPPLPEAS